MSLKSHNHPITLLAVVAGFRGPLPPFILIYIIQFLTVPPQSDEVVSSPALPLGISIYDQLSTFFNSLVFGSSSKTNKAGITTVSDETWWSFGFVVFVVRPDEVNQVVSSESDGLGSAEAQEGVAAASRALECFSDVYRCGLLRVWPAKPVIRTREYE